MLDLIEHGGCGPSIFVAINSIIATIDGFIAALAFSQLLRIHLRNQQIGWTRQKVFHLLIGSSNTGYMIYFISTLVTNCKRWLCWSHACGFVLMACPQILFLAAFLLLLSFWVDLCHQANDEDDEDEDNSAHEALLEKPKTRSGPLYVDNCRKCFSFQGIHVGSRQRFVILVIVLIFALMIAFAVLIWIGLHRSLFHSNPSVGRSFSLLRSGLLLFLKMSKVRSEKAPSEMWKVAGLAAVSVVCFTSSALVALITYIPVLYHWNSNYTNGVNMSLLIIFYYLIGSSLPSTFVLWVMREMPPQIREAESRVVTYIRDMPAATPHPQRWTEATSSQNQIQNGSPLSPSKQNPTQKVNIYLFFSLSILHLPGQCQLEIVSSLSDQIFPFLLNCLIY
ncbi:tobamovirus multiplication protein isoform X2 [Tasmannia lanceolata]|uniref:tobamovirus multiplication protein isoform X2 n=1 Tax=Tasmannia lanceolata TaxID=3420 RepID=UPI004062C1E1